MKRGAFFSSKTLLVLTAFTCIKTAESNEVGVKCASFLMEALRAQSQLSRSINLELHGRYKVTLLDGFAAANRWRHFLYRSNDKRPVLDDKRWQEVFSNFSKPWGCDIAIKETYTGNGHIFEADHTNEYWDGTYYVRKKEKNNEVELGDAPLAPQIPDYLSILYTVNGLMEVGKDSARNWSGDAIPLVNILSRAITDGQIEGTPEHFKLSYLGFKNIPDLKLMMEVWTVPGKPFLLKEVKVGSCPARFTLPIDKITGSKTVFEEYTQVLDNMWIPKRIISTAYTSTGFELTDEQRSQIGQKMRMPEPDFTVETVKHEIVLDQLSQIAKPIEITIPVQHGTLVHDMILHKKYIFGQKMIEEVKKLKGEK